MDAPFSNLPGSNCACQMEHPRNTPAGALSQGSIARRSCRCMKGPSGGLWAAFRRQRLQDFVIKMRGYFAADEHIRCNFNGARDPEDKMCFLEKNNFYHGFIVRPVSQLKSSPRWAMQKADKEAENRSWFPALSRQRLRLPLPLLLCSLEVL